MTLTIIGISGKLTSGKTTLANAIIGARPEFVRCALADALKNDIANLCGVPREYLDSHKGEFREILQVYGLLMRGLHGEDYWVKRLEESIWDEGYTHIIVDDVRFPNELAGIRKMGRCITARLEITPDEQEQRCRALFGAPLIYAKLIHPSETSLDTHAKQFDVLLDACLPTSDQLGFVLDALLKKP